MTTESFGGKADAKSTITNAFLGLLIAVSIFIILNTINPDLLNLDPSIATLSVDGAAELNDDGSYSVSRGGEPTTYAISGVDVTKGSDWKDRPGLVDIRPNLPAGVTVNKPECEKVGDSCTSMMFLPTMAPKAIQLIKRIQQGCNCEFDITGGSEFWWHKTHGPDVLVFDISINRGDTQLLSQFLSNLNAFPNNNKWYPVSGIVDALAEKGKAPHWHVKDL